MGTPRKRRKTVRVVLRVSPEEKETLESAAQLANLDLSPWMRSRLLRDASLELESRGKDVPHLRRLGGGTGE